MMRAPVLADALVADNPIRKVAAVIAGSLLLWASAKVQIPFYPVPMTMQTFAVLTLGMALGARLGGATVLLYLAEGAAGLPVFAGAPERGIGLAYLVGPTGGYLVGFLLAAIAVGVLAERRWDRHVLTTVAAMAIGLTIIFALGLAWLGVVVGWDKPLLQLGLVPFLPGEVFKLALAAAVLPLTWRTVARDRR